MHNGILIPPGVRQKLKSHMASPEWSDEYQLRNLVCTCVDDLLEDLDTAQFGLTKEVAMTYFQSTNSMPYGSDMDACCEELIKKYPDSLRKMFNGGMRKKLGMVATMLLGHMRVSHDHMSNHDILKELMVIRWDNPNSMVDASASIKALQIRLKFKLNDMENYLRDDSDYDGLTVVYPKVIEDRLQTLIDYIPNLSERYFKGIVAELDIISKCVVSSWRKDKMKIRDYHKIACKWMLKIDMSEDVSGLKELAPSSPKENDIDPAIVIMTDLLHEAIAQIGRAHV